MNKAPYPPTSFSFSESFCPSAPFLSVAPHPVFLTSGLSLRVGDVDVFFLQSKVVSGPRKIRSRGSWSHIVSKATDA